MFSYHSLILILVQSVWIFFRQWNVKYTLCLLCVCPSPCAFHDYTHPLVLGLFPPFGYREQRPQWNCRDKGNAMLQPLRNWQLLSPALWHHLLSVWQVHAFWFLYTLAITLLSKPPKAGIEKVKWYCAVVLVVLFWSLHCRTKPLQWVSNTRSHCGLCYGQEWPVSFGADPYVIF